jgi:ParB-like chromosome segregation protein Spo0J
VLQPILLRPDGGPDTYELVAGERRFRAAKAPA